MADGARDELRNAKDHAKEALKATLLAARGALDLAIQKLDDNDAAATADDGGAETAPKAEEPAGHGPV